MITDRDIARWRLHSQLLAAPVDGAEEVVRSLLAVQAENPSQSAWAVATRTTSPRQGDLADAIADGRVLRTHVLRPTWHYVHAEDARWLLELTAPRVLPTVDQQLRPLADGMTTLTDATGAAFDKQFLTMMIAHHEGAITMADEETAQGSNPDAKTLAAKIATDQQADGPIAHDHLLSTGTSAEVERAGQGSRRGQ